MQTNQLAAQVNYLIENCINPIDVDDLQMFVLCLDRYIAGFSDRPETTPGQEKLIRKIRMDIQDVNRQLVSQSKEQV